MKPERHHIEPYQQPPRLVPLREVTSHEVILPGHRPPEVRTPEFERQRRRPVVKPPEIVAPDAANDRLKCVWSGYPDYNRDCRSRIPASVVVKAWQREMQLEEAVEGFFYFAWRSGVWLAYGSSDGRVRGVYCPTHCSERDTRTPVGTPHDETHSKGHDEQAGTHPRGHTPRVGGQAGEVRVQDRRGDQSKGIALH